MTIYPEVIDLQAKESKLKLDLEKVDDLHHLVIIILIFL